MDDGAGIKIVSRAQIFFSGIPVRLSVIARDMVAEATRIFVCVWDGVNHRPYIPIRTRGGGPSVCKQHIDTRYIYIFVYYNQSVYIMVYSVLYIVDVK